MTPFEEGREGELRTVELQRSDVDKARWNISNGVLPDKPLNFEGKYRKEGKCLGRRGGCHDYSRLKIKSVVS